MSVMKEKVDHNWHLTVPVQDEQINRIHKISVP